MQIGQRVAAAGMLVSGALAVIKVFAGISGHSTAVVADGMESAGDGSPEFYTGSTEAIQTTHAKYFTYPKTTDIGQGSSITGNTITWTSGKASPVSRSEAMTAVIDDKMYVLGGYTNGVFTLG